MPYMKLREAKNTGVPGETEEQRRDREAREAEEERKRLLRESQMAGGYLERGKRSRKAGMDEADSY